MCLTQTGQADIGRIPTPRQVSDVVTRYAPVPVTSAGGDRYLINAAVVFYVVGRNGQPVQDVTINNIPLLGHTLTARLHLTTTDWNWGDGTTSTGLSGAGMPYTDSVPCESRTECSSYISHVFAHTGPATVVVTAHWSVTVTMDKDIPLRVDGEDLFRTDPDGHPVAIVQARSVLVPR